MNDIVLIGKVTGSTPNLVQLEYPSVSGIHSVRIPRTMLARFERISRDRVAALVRTDDSERGQQLDNELVNSHAPLHITEEQMAIVMAMENDEMIPEINIVNSYDGTVGLNILGGAFRLICSNGLVIGFIASKYTNKHIKTNIALNDLDRIIEETVNNTSLIFNEEFPILAETKFQERHLLDFIRLFPEYANTLVTDKIIIENPKTFWDLLNVGTNILTHHMNRDMDSTHNLESKLYPKVKKLALKEAKVAVA